METTVKLVTEIPFNKGDAENLGEIVNTALSLLEDNEILTLPMRKTKKTIKINGKLIQILESSVDTSKKMRISKID